MTRCAAIVLSWALLVLLAVSPSRAGEPTGLKKVIDLDAKDEPLASVVDRIRTMTGENIVLGLDKDGKPLAENKELRVTIKLEGAFWEAALRLACEDAGAKTEVLEGNIWRVYEPPEVILEAESRDVRVEVGPKGLGHRAVSPGTRGPRQRGGDDSCAFYSLALAEADLGVAVLLLADLGKLNVAFDSSLVRGRRVTLRLRDLPWEKSLDVVVRAAGLVLVADGEGGRKKVVESGAKSKATSREPAGEIATNVSGIRVSVVLFRLRGGKGLVVVNGEPLLEGEEKPVVLPASGKTARVRLEKVQEDGSAVLSVDGERRVVKAGAGGD